MKSTQKLSSILYGARPILVAGTILVIVNGMKWNFLELHLNDLRQDLNQDEHFFKDEVPILLTLYKRILLDYLQGDLEQMRDNLGYLESMHPGSIFTELARLRHQIRTLDVQEVQISNLLKFSDENLEPCLCGKKYFVLGLSYEVLNHYLQMKESFERASRYFVNGGLLQKSLKSLHNAVSANSNLAPSEFFLNEYQNLYVKALAIGDHEISAMALYNISVHFHKLGALRAAVKNIDAARVMSEMFYFGKNRYLILLQSCRIYADLNRLSEVQDCLETCLLSF